MQDLIFFSDIEAIAKNLKLFKEKEVIIAKHFSDREELLALKKKIKGAGLHAKTCHLIEEEKEKSKNEFQGIADFFGFVGGTVSKNKTGVSSKGIDFLLRPVGRERLEFDGSLANSAKENGLAVGICFSDFLNSSQRDLVSLLRNHFLLAKLCKKAGVPLLVFSGANNAEEMRSEADLLSFFKLLANDSIEEGENNEKEN